jgi:hypothetical protein
MGNWLKDNSLSLVMLLLFALFAVLQAVTGHAHYNEEQREHGEPEVPLSEYLTKGEFWQTFFENWESEFLQMGAYVFLTAFLYQKGSAESRKRRGEESDKDPMRARHGKQVPYPVRHGSKAMVRVYEHSLSIAFLALFLLSFLFHAMGGAADYNEQQREHGSDERVTTLSYMGTSRFWFESFQNWQSEFLAVFAMVVLSIFLRQRGSPESKRVAAPHDETGSG